MPAYPTLRRLDAVLPGLGQTVADAGGLQDGGSHETFYEGEPVFRMRMPAILPCAQMWPRGVHAKRRAPFIERHPPRARR